jgi:hypothetical protein
VLVDLTRGKVELDVDKRGERDPLVVRAGDTDVIVVGTHFTVDCGATACRDGEVDVRVTEGVVKVVRHGQPTVRVAAGTTWKTRRGLLALADARAADAVAAVDAAPSTDIEIEVRDGPDVLEDRTAAVPGARAPTVLRDPVKSTMPRADRPARTPADGAGAGSAALDLRTAIRRQPFAPAADVGESDAEKAAAKLRQVGYGVGDDAPRALYSLAVLQAERLGRTADALRTLDLFMTRFAHKAEHADAMWLRVRVLCLKAIDQRCRQAAYTYMREAPGTPAAAIAERITLTD